jgi:hypothetical protein
MGDRDAFSSGARARLGVSSDATLEEVKARWRELARQLHPDVAGRGGATAQRWLEVQEAYNLILRDDGPARRQSEEALRMYRLLKRRSTPLWLSAAALVGGVGVFAAALNSHQQLFGKSNYTVRYGGTADWQSARLTLPFTLAALRVRREGLRMETSRAKCGGAER